MTFHIKPIIKWVGGKSQIIDQVIGLFPKEINNYYEIFLGGGSVLFALLESINNKTISVKNIFAFDANETLINLYINIQKNPNKVIDELNIIKKEYSSINGTGKNKKPKNLEDALTSNEGYYYWKRIEYNKMIQNEKNTPKGTAYFIFLNKTCFRGLYRMGPNGFNVPFGNYKNPEIFDENHIKQVSKLIQNVTFQCLDFSQSIIKAENKDDFLYLDPPYAPENKTSFVSYLDGGFNIDKHNELFKLCNDLNGKNIKFLMSNSDVDLVKNAFDEKFEKKTIICKRSINSKKPSAKTNELLIYLKEKKEVLNEIKPQKTKKNVAKKK